MLGKKLLPMAVLASLAVAVCAKADAQRSSPAPKEGALLTASFDPELGFGFDATSLERLPWLLAPGEVLEVEVGGVVRSVEEVEWSAVAERGLFPLVAVANAGNTRRVGELKVTTTRNTPCTDAVDGEALPVERRVEDGFENAGGPGDDPIPIGQCIFGDLYFRCLNCQCRSGIYVRGRSRRYICIYGTLYPQNVYNCNCSFTTRICGGGNT